MSLVDVESLWSPIVIPGGSCVCVCGWGSYGTSPLEGGSGRWHWWKCTVCLVNECNSAPHQYSSRRQKLQGSAGNSWSSLGPCPWTAKVPEVGTKIIITSSVYSAWYTFAPAYLPDTPSDVSEGDQRGGPRTSG